MTRKFAALFIMSCFWLWIGCAVVAVGTGVGVGTYTYLKGDLKRAYNAQTDVQGLVKFGIIGSFEISLQVGVGADTHPGSDSHDGTADP